MYDDLVQFHFDVLIQVGADQETADAVSKGLSEASLRGVDSHGARLFPHYIRSAQGGRKNPRPSYKFTQKFPAIGLLDADNTFGHAAGMKAIDHGIKMASEYGMGAVGVRNSSHPGAMASFTLKAARQGYIAMAFTHAPAKILSSNGKRSFFGTNPICIAVPREEQEPYCLDMATSMISWNKLLLYQSTREALPEQVAGDREGLMTTDPHQASHLMPAGGYKGYGLASMVEILCGIYTGMLFGPHLPPIHGSPMDRPRHLAQFYWVLRADGCVPQDTFIQLMQQMTDEVRSEPAQPGETVMLPGDPEIQEAARRRIDGIPLDPKTAGEFENLSQQFKVPLHLLEGDH
ncbi:MAG: Ldh family oxidoreductase [SAR324 cluster bacterium]|nr:Ldh family oxidoreductase [SAR324 cluster bacterium]